MRVFAGPNGSGKSSIIKQILETKVSKNKTLDFGIYVNADDIASLFQNTTCKFEKYNISATLPEILDIANNSGLINDKFSLDRFKACICFENNQVSINHTVADEKDDKPYERIAQIIADYLRKKLLENEAKFSFETVFSHESKIDIIRKAKEQGYKVYLYFVSTEDPWINVYRVKVVRVGELGHDVDEDKIVNRYYRSMDQMYEAAQHCYQAYFFDNSSNGNNHSLFAHFKLNREGKKEWDPIDKTLVPSWFIKYYSEKIKK